MNYAEFYTISSPQLMAELKASGLTELEELVMDNQDTTLPILEDFITIWESEIFGDEEGHECLCVCYDGYALCQEYDTHKTFKQTYPLLEEVLKDEIMQENIRECRGLPYRELIHYGDIMMYLGEIVKQ
jgi:hypothetical protein